MTDEAPQNAPGGWSRDAMQIVFSSERFGQSDIWVTSRRRGGRPGLPEPLGQEWIGIDTPELPASWGSIKTRYH